MERKHRQMTYKTDEAALQQAFAALDEAKDDSSDDALADLADLPALPEQGEEHYALVIEKKPKD